MMIVIIIIIIIQTTEVSLQPDKCSYLLAVPFQSKNTYDPIILVPSLFSLFCLLGKKPDAEHRAAAEGIIFHVT